MVTIYAFSTENWDRDEVGGLFRILAEAITREAPKLHRTASRSGTWAPWTASATLAGASRRPWN